MKWLILFACAAVAASAISYRDVVQEEWNSFKLKYNKSYASAMEEQDGMIAYALNKYRVAHHNRRFSLGLSTFRLGLNKYSDHKEHVIQSMHDGFTRKVRDKPRAKASAMLKSSPFVEVPDKVNWTRNGAVTEVKEHGLCEASWAFAAAGALEGQLFLKEGHTVSLSTQNLIDCSGLYGNQGCDYGTPEYAFSYVAANGGLDTDASYPYKQVEGPCRYNSTNSAVNDRGFLYYDKDENALKQGVAKYGPVTALIDASHESFLLYQDGVYYEKECDSTNGEHAVLIVGYGTDSPGGDYWLIKTSLGTSWGMEGYMKLARNRGNHCGVASQACHPLL